MRRLISGIALVALAVFMLFGYLKSDVHGGTAAVALAITVLLPGAWGSALIGSHFRDRSRVGVNKDSLRQQTLEAELLRVAGNYGGKLTIVEAVRDLAVSPDDAKQALDSLSTQGIADFEVTESGVVVYVFHDMQKLSEKSSAKGILE